MTCFYLCDNTRPATRTPPRSGLIIYGNALVLALALSFAGRECAAQTNAFTYQGRLSDASGPVNGHYDFTFQLFDAPSGGNQVKLTTTNANVAVSNGLFTVLLNFGAGAFPGADRWLQAGVRTNGSTGAFSALAPRQLLTPAPYSLYAPNAATAATANNVAANSVTGAGIQNSSITAGKIASGQVVKSLNGLFDNVTLSAGANVTLTPSGNGLQIAASGGAANAIANLNGNGTNTTLVNPSADKLTFLGTGNVTFFNTNMSGVVFGVDTNAVIVTDAGMTNVWGHYIYAYNYTTADADSVSVFTNSSPFQIHNDPDGFTFGCLITNTSNGGLYYLNNAVSIPGSATAITNADKPNAVLSWGNVTNLASKLFVAGGTVPTPTFASTLLVDPINGDDVFGKPGRADLPFRTLTVAAQNAQAGQTIQLAPGVFNEDRTITLLAGVNLIGAGRGITKVVGASTGNAYLQIASGTVLRDFSTANMSLVLGPSIATTVTNALLYNLDINGSIDGLLAANFRQFTAIDCRFSSKYDSFNEWAGGLTTNSVATFFNCVFDSEPLGTVGSRLARGIVVSAVSLRAYGCTFKTRGIESITSGQISAGIVEQGTNGTVECWGCNFDYGNTATNRAVWNPYGTPILIHGQKLPPDSIYGVGPTYDVIGVTTNYTVPGGATFYITNGQIGAIR